MTKRLNRSLEEYEQANGWSSHLFADAASKLFKKIRRQGITVKIGRTVVVLEKDSVILKCYVHYRGFSKEYATVTDQHGKELLTVHYTKISKLIDYINDKFNFL